MIFGLTYYEICLDFLIYSFLGWVVEVVFHAAKLGKIVNRGFLNGPVCPVYGFGVVGLLMLLKTISPSTSAEHTNVVLLFFAGMIFCSAVELFAGWILDRLFHMRWWDYSHEPYNLHGYICLRFSLLWGVACVAVIGVIYPSINQVSGMHLSETIGWRIMLVLYIIYFIDLVVTVSVIVGLNRKLKEIDRLQKSLRTVSDHLTENIGTTAYKASEKIGESAVQASLARENLQDMARAVKIDAQYKKQDLAENMIDAGVSLQMKRDDSRKRLLEMQKELRSDAVRKASGLHRILKAFPDLQSHISHETIVDLETEINQAEQLIKEETSFQHHQARQK